MKVFLEALPWFGAAISLWGTVLCAIEVNRREAQPRFASWIAWGTSNAVFSVLALLHGNYLSAGFNGFAAVCNFSILILCVYRRVGARPSGTTDWTCLTLTALCLVVIGLSQGATYTAFVAMAANIAATWPTMKHAWQKPHEEPWRMFAANAGANGLGLTGIVVSGGAGLAIIAGPLISMLGNIALVAITAGRTWMAKFIDASEAGIKAEVAELQGFVAAEVAAFERAENRQSEPELVGASPK